MAFQINLKSGASTLVIHVSWTSTAELNGLKKQLHTLLDRGLMRPSTSLTEVMYFLSTIIAFGMFVFTFSTQGMSPRSHPLKRFLNTEDCEKSKEFLVGLCSERLMLHMETKDKSSPIQKENYPCIWIVGAVLLVQKATRKVIQERSLRYLRNNPL